MEKGLVILLTGEGKGKTNSALGMALRAAGQGLKVLWLQFLGGGELSTEHKALERIQGVRVCSVELGVPAEGPWGSEQCQEKARVGLEKARREMISGKWHMLILDEVISALQAGIVPEELLMHLIEEKPWEIHLVLTGRGATPAILEVADTVTEMVPRKHDHEPGHPPGESVHC